VGGSRSEFAASPGVLCPASFLLWFLSLRISWTAGFGAPTARAALENVSMMQQAIQHGGEHTFAEAVPVIVRVGVAPKDELISMLHEMRRLADDERVPMAQWCMPGVIAVK